jgi:hypothetical protein
MIKEDRFRCLTVMKIASTHILILILLLAGNHALAQDTIYLSPQGSDKNSGISTELNSTDGPVATLHAAVDRIRSLSRKGSPGMTFRIIMKGGIYPVHQPVIFTPEDDFTLWMETSQRELPVISAGREIRTGNFSDVGPRSREKWRAEYLEYVVKLPGNQGHVE